MPTRLVKSSRTLSILYYLVDNLSARARGLAGPVRDRCGATLGYSDTRTALEYAFTAYREYVAHFRPDRPLAGSHILEIGYGDNLGVALLLLACGAESVTCIDRFRVVRDPQRELALYRGIRDRLEGEARERFDRAICLDNGIPAVRGSALRVHDGVAAEEVEHCAGASTFDYALSKAVMEHVADVPAALAAIDRVLRPGGRMVHHIDLRDHGMFTDGGASPFELLTVPEWLWRAMTSHSGKPNRVRLSQYVRLLAALGYDCETRMSFVRGHPDELLPNRRELVRGEDYDDSDIAAVEAIRPRLAAPFRDLPAEELLVGAFVLVATKPPA